MSLFELFIVYKYKIQGFVSTIYKYKYQGLIKLWGIGERFLEMINANHESSSINGDNGDDVCYYHGLMLKRMCVWMCSKMCR